MEPLGLAHWFLSERLRESEHCCLIGYQERQYNQQTVHGHSASVQVGWYGAGKAFKYCSNGGCGRRDMHERDIRASVEKGHRNCVPQGMKASLALRDICQFAIFLHQVPVELPFQGHAPCG